MWKFLPILLLSAACTGSVPEHPDLSSFLVTINPDSFPELAKGELLDVPTAPMRATVDVQAIGREGEAVSWDGLGWLKVRPGRISGSNRVEIKDGVATEVEVEFVYTWGEARIWVEDRGEIDEPGTFAVGVTDPLPFELPTVADVQRPSTVDYGDESCFSPWGFEPDCAGLSGDFVRMRGMDQGRRLMVTNVTTDGFYASDLDSPPGNYGSIFAFNFSRPRVEVGDLLSFLSGNVAEFIGFTELNYPVWDTASSGHVLPDPIDISAALSSSGATSDEQRNAFLERYESSRVMIPDALFAADLFDEETYYSFAQWPVRVPGITGAEFTIISQYEAPQFDPLCWKDTMADTSMGPIVGHLRHIGPANPEWVIDLDGPYSFHSNVRDSDCWTGGTQRNGVRSSGPRLSQDYYYRDLPSCSGMPFDVEDQHLHR